ncbi:PREDICTED: (E,E)-geranyllinalool synthase [Tarenaya hassleriana]|uniref:(E,E)-geranyllinalool synthase n=1 Tax=Tarenaya hassleriana TaxID=28532 RepID=UPI00053C3A36|nr:PREDICTED: (E,E)-geranyllinalool synthase [Tarenaya hassleriana]
MNKLEQSLDLYVLSEEIRSEIFSLDYNKKIMDPYSLVSPSAYDMAWLAMVENDPRNPSREPMFQDCLEWILSNQNGVEGYWGNCDGHGNPTSETLTSTLACLLALHKWNCGSRHIEKGMRYMERFTETVLEGFTNDGSFPRWFVIMFGGMLGHAQELGLEFAFSNRSNKLIKHLFHKYFDIFQREKLVDDHSHYPLVAYLEALPSTHVVNQDEITQSLCADGSLLGSPSATAAAFMITRNPKCLAYLKSLVQRCPRGVPQTYPLNGELIKLSMVNLLESFGLSEYFSEEIEHVLHQIHRSYEDKGEHEVPINLAAEKLHKDSLAFRLSRMHGRVVSPRRFCWFLNDEEIRGYVEKNQECFSSAMLSVYRATDLMFHGESELEEARDFSLQLLKSTGFINEQTVKHETSVSWMARLRHLEHRMRIEDKDSNALYTGKASHIRLHSLYSNKLTHLASRNFEFRQSIYRRELEELKIWAKKSGLSDMGFGREKTAYCYYAVASSSSLPCESVLRNIIAKSGILITVADDFFDEEGSLDELNALTNAVLRWEGEELKGHSKIIFGALDDLVREMAETCLDLHGTDTTVYLRDIWKETFVSWLREAEWASEGYVPNMDEYIRNGMISIATHTIVLTSSCLLDQSLPNHTLEFEEYETLTRLLMAIPRLLNDLQSYRKEQEQGKINSVLLHMKKNDSRIEDSIAYIEGIIDTKRKEFLEHVLMDGFSDLPKQCKELHLSCCKVFEVFFNDKNRYDSETEMLQDIRNALYDPINVTEFDPPLMGHGKPVIVPLPPKNPQISQSYPEKKKFPAIKSRLYPRHFHNQKPGFDSKLSLRKPLGLIAQRNTAMMPRFSPCFY